MQREIQEAAYRYQQEVEAKARIVVGVNEFAMDEPPPANLFQVDPAVAPARGGAPGAAPAHPRRRRARRGRSRPSIAPPAAATTSCRSILDAVRASVTLGEICATLRGVFGVHQPSVVF